MSIGLPAHLRPQSLSRAFARASHVVALVCILAALIIVAAVQASDSTAILWPAMIALVPVLVSLWRLDRHRTLFYTVTYLVIGGASSYWFALTVMSEFGDIEQTDSFVLTMLRLALMLVGGAGAGIASGLMWSAVGLLVAEVSIAAAASQTGTAIVPDWASIVALIGIAATLVLIHASRDSVRRAQPSLNRAAQEEHLATMRYGIEVKAAAVMHDTILNHLAAIAQAPRGGLDSCLQSQIERDLEFLVGEEWLADTSPTVDVQARADWQHSELFQAIQESRRLGLDIDVTGDIVAIGRLASDRSTALGLAVKQCLVNVLKHAETDHAEVVVYGSEHDVSVMVIDNGKGFSESETGPDRLGLRQSVRRRIEAVGGDVQVWSTPGSGTSVMIRVPAMIPQGDSIEATS